MSSRLFVAGWGALLCVLGGLPADAQSSASMAVRCAPIGMCFCVDTRFVPVIDKKVLELRSELDAARRAGKTTMYLSTPLSTRGGSHFNVNAAAAKQTAERITNRLGSAHTYVLNPAASDLPDLDNTRAGQGEYMLLWAAVLGGPLGLAEHFDAVYFIGPDDYAAAFGFDGRDDLAKLAAEFDRLMREDPRFRKDVEAGRLNKTSFVTYYGLRASSAFSAGARDEWNIARLANQRRRASSEYEAGKQLGLLFNGGAVDPADYEDDATPGNAALSCPPT